MILNVVYVEKPMAVFFIFCNMAVLIGSKSLLEEGCAVQLCRFPHHVLNPRPSAVKVQSPNHWTARKFPKSLLKYNF